jgi:20S proteasome alpha/beta subunit
MLTLLFIRNPLITGTSVLAFKYRDGVMMAADMLGKKKKRKENTINS